MKRGSSAHTQRIVVGAIVGSFGVRGAMKVAAADPEIFRVGLQVELRRNEGQKVARVIRAARRQGQTVILELEGVDTADAAKLLQGSDIAIAREDLPKLSDREYREIDLVGLQVRDRVLGDLGLVKEVRHYPGSDMLVVGPRDALIPMLAAYAIEIDRDGGAILVTLPAGFEDLL